jgi:YgiT-type zinc finger domain-containing protein
MPLKADAVLCPFCFVEYEEIEEDFELDNQILHAVKMLRCPSCKEELFTAEQQKKILKRIQ